MGMLCFIRALIIHSHDARRMTRSKSSLLNGLQSTVNVGSRRFSFHYFKVILKMCLWKRLVYLLLSVGLHSYYYVRTSATKLLWMSMRTRMGRNS